MTLRQRLRSIALVTAGLAVMAGAVDAAPQALTKSDARLYSAALDATDRGDFIDAGLQLAQAGDASLAGYVTLLQLMHPTAHKASFDELAAWLDRYADLPGAERIYALAVKRAPEGGAGLLRRPVLAGFDWMGPRPARRATGADPKARPAREAFYGGDVKRALDLAASSGERWIAGLSAYRLNDYALAESFFAPLARDENEDEWLRAAAAYWASRTAGLTGAPERADAFLKMAADHPTTFYGMIAERQLRRTRAERRSQPAQADAATGPLVLAAYGAPSSAPSAALVDGFVRSNPRAHRAAALAQIGRIADSALELRAGLALAATKAERDGWTALILSLNAPDDGGRPVDVSDYPTPDLEPGAGFTIDKALVYAIVRQESRFNPSAVSPAGAVGLMQLMPATAAQAAGDDKLMADMTPLFEPSYNLRVGQDYVNWLMNRGVGYDILRTVAAYNGGPATLAKTTQMLGEEADSLLVIECLPSVETRNYVERVMAAYWTYRAKWGQENRTLDALAAGAKFVDARLDR